MIIATLAIGIGAGTAVFSIASAVLLRPLPYADPARLVRIFETNPLKNWTRNIASPANYADWTRQNTVFTDVAAYEQFNFNGSGASEVFLTGPGEPQGLKALGVTGNLFTEIKAVDRDLALTSGATMRAVVDESMGDHRFRTTLLSLFAGVALLLAALGIYGVPAYFVSQRSRELGIRLALGAKPEALFRMVVGQGDASGGDRRRTRPGGGGNGHQADAIAALRRDACRPGGVRGGDGDARRHRARRVRGACAPGHARGSAGGAPGRMRIADLGLRIAEAQSATIRIPHYSAIRNPQSAISGRGELFFEQLLLMQLGVQAVVTDQPVVSAALGDAAFVEHEDDVGVAHRGNPVRNDD